MHIEISLAQGTVAQVRIQGEIDLASSPELKERLLGLLEGGTIQLLLDLRDVRYIDSSGLIALVVLLKRVREHGGGLVFVCSHPGILRVFRITGLSHVFEVVHDEEDGLRRLRQLGERSA